MKRVLGLIFIVLGAMFLLLGGTVAVVILLNARAGDVAIAAVFGTVAVVGITLVVVGWKLFRSAPPIGVVPKPVEGRVGGFLANLPERREQNGRPFEVQYLAPIPGKHGRPSSLFVRVPAATPTTVKFHRENWFDRFSKSIGIAREHQSGDDEFDAAVYVRCPSHAYAELYLADADRRAAVLAIRNLGFWNVQLTGTQAVAHWPQFDPAKHDHPELVSAAADLLALMAKDVPAEDPDNAAARPDRRGWLAFLWLFAILYAISIFSLIAFPPLHTSSLVLTAAPVFIGGYVLFGWIAAFVLRGTSTAHDVWAPLVIVGLLFHGLGSIGTTAAINGLADPGPLAERDLTIVDKRSHTSSGKNKKTTYYARVSSWEPGGGTLEFEVGLGEYNAIVPGRSKMHLVTGPGRLGFEWLKSQRVMP